MKHDLRIEKGLETKKRIMECAKSAFQNNGYKNATIVEITQAAGVPIGLFTYYFKTKSNIVTHVHFDYLQRIRAELELFDWIKDETPLFIGSVENYIYYKNIFDSAEVSRFYLEVLYGDLQENFIYETDKTRFEEYIKYYSIDISENELEILLTFINGGKKNLIIKYFENTLKVDKNDVLNFIVFNDINLTKASDGEKTRVKDKILSRAPGIDLSGIEMLN